MDITKVISVSAACLALILAAAALVVSLTHAGPQGLRGAQGLKGIQGAQGTSGSAGLSARLLAPGGMSNEQSIRRSRRHRSDSCAWAS